MRILVTGASGVFGRDVTRRLWMKGHDVVALSRSRPANLPSGVEFISADIRDGAKVEKAMAGCDAVVHLAWTVTPSRRVEDHHEIDIDGTQNVLDAMTRTGCGRIVFASSVTAYGALPDNPSFLKEDDPLRPPPEQIYATNKAAAEKMIIGSGASAVLIRASVVLGREVDNVGMRLFTTPSLVQVRGDPGRMQLLHPEDIGRFFAEAVSSDKTGPVNLAASDVLTMAEVGRLMEKRVVVVRESMLKRAMDAMWKYNLAEVDPAAYQTLRFMPVVDTTALREQWGFRCGYTTAGCVADFARATNWFRYLGRRRVELPWRTKYPVTRVPLEVPPPDGAEMAAAAPPGVAGEFDSLVDPRYAGYTAANTSEAFPGPLTPMSLEVGLRGMRAAAEMTGHVIGIAEPLRSHLWHRSTSLFGHAVYANLSVIHEMAQQMPGYDPEAWNELMFGGAETHAETPAASKSQAARTAGRVGPRLGYYSKEIARFERQMPGLVMSEAELAELPDERLLAQLGLMHDMVVYSWGLAATASAWAAAVFGAIEKKAGSSVAVSIRGGRERLASAGALLAVQQLAAQARREPAVAEILRSRRPADALAEIRTSAPAFARMIDEAIARHGHRGPWETELSNFMFGDAPELLIDSVAKHLDVAERPAPPVVRLRANVRGMAKIGHHFQRTRERGRDAAMAMTHQYRLAARERGRRLARDGILADPTDVYYLTLDQASEPPLDVKEIVARRRAERERLASLSMPITFTGRWEAEATDADPLKPGEELSGIPASSGVIRGVVRILRSGTADDLQPGEVLVAKLTDTGWTPLFGYAAAVVTDMGGQLSHAAVVAREFGIPCVVQTNDATLRLRDGQTVEVDGATGVVRAID
jgi:nucleoside-diphosphate-sugar epimerase/phosphohistidine swiveling domain-containing protein